MIGFFQKNTKWTIFWLIMILWVIGAIGLWFHSTSLEPPVNSSKTLEGLKNIFLWLGGLGIVLPTYLNIWQSIENNKQTAETIRFNKMENSFKLISAWDDSSLLEARDFTRKIGKEKSDLSDNELIKKINDDEQLERSIINILNFFDTIRLSIHYDRVDGDFIKKSMNEVIIKIIDRFRPWVKEKLSEQSIKDAEELYSFMKK